MPVYSWPSPAARMVLLGLLALTGAAGAADLAVLPTYLNGLDAGEMTVFFDDRDVFVRVDDLYGAGLQDLSGLRRVFNGETFVSLASLAPAVSWQFDESNLLLILTAEPSLLPREHRDLRTQRPTDMVYSSDPSGFVNYSASLDDGGDFSGFSEAGWSRGRALLYSSVSRQPDGEVLRGLTNWTLDDRDRLIRWVAGDSFAAGGNLGGGALLAGLSVARNFGLDPYFYPHTVSGGNSITRTG